MTDQPLSRDADCVPGTFAERGVAVPFTTPALSGTRLRASRRFGLDYLVPNPAGGRGLYVQSWFGVLTMCAPTLHDRALSERLADVARPDPGAVRAAARAVAAEGLAGQAAREAALAANAADARARAEIARRLRAIRAEGQAVPAEVVLGALATRLAAVGLGKTRGTSLVARATVRLEAFAEAAEAWARTQSGLPREAAAALADAARTTLACVDAARTVAAKLMRDLPALLAEASGTAPVRTPGRPTAIERVDRLEWLLDGWPAVAATWSAASCDAERRSRLPELVLTAPLLPREASEWIGHPVATETLARLRRDVDLTDERRAEEALLDAVARHEAARADAA